MKTLFAIVAGLFRNQDRDTLSLMVGDALGVDEAAFESCSVETQVTDAGVRVKVEVFDEDEPKAEHKLVLVPIDGEILYRLSLAVENGCEEDEQREMWGDKTVDWVNAVIEQHGDMSREFYESLK